MDPKEPITPGATPPGGRSRKEAPEEFAKLDTAFHVERKEKELLNADAQQRFDRLVHEHPSFADPVWGRARQQYFLMRDKKLAGDGPDGHWESTPEHERELRVLSYLEFLIGNAQKKFGRRAMMIESVRRLLPETIAGQEPGLDRISRTRERLFLGIAIRNRTMTLEQIRVWYGNEMKRPGLSLERGEEIDEHLKKISTWPEEPKMAAREPIVLEDSPHHPPAPRIALPERESDPEGIEAVLVDEEDEVQSDKEESMIRGPAMKEVAGRNAASSTAAIEVRTPPTKTFAERVANARLRASVGDSAVSRMDHQETLDGLESVETDELISLEHALGASVDVFRGPLSDEMIDAMERDLSQSSDPEVRHHAQNLLIVKTRIEALRKWLAMHEEDLSDLPTHSGQPPQPPIEQTPEERLGVAFDASAEDVEVAFAQAMQGLDFESETDRQRIVATQGARERMLQRAEQRGRDAERLRNLREALGPATGAPREIVLETPRIEKPEGWWSRNLRTPGAKIRALFVGAAGLAGAGAIALQELGENESEPSHVVAGALEDPKIDETSVELSGIDVAEDKNTEGPGPSAVVQLEAPATDHVVMKGETLWRVLKDKIQDRGLRVTNEKIVTLKHFADLENPTVDWDHLQVGQAIHLASVESMLDEMEGKPASSSPMSPQPISGSSSSIEHQPHDVSQSIAQQQHVEVSPSWIAGSAMPGHELIAAKAYEDIPREGNTSHVMAKGEWIYKLIHLMLRDSGLNWSTPRITKLKNMTLQENGLSEEHAKKIPVGAIITFDSAVREIQAMKAAKEKGKKK